MSDLHSRGPRWPIGRISVILALAIFMLTAWGCGSKPELSKAEIDATVSRQADESSPRPTTSGGQDGSPRNYAEMMKKGGSDPYGKVQEYFKKGMTPDEITKKVLEDQSRLQSEGGDRGSNARSGGKSHPTPAALPEPKSAPGSLASDRPRAGEGSGAAGEDQVALAPARESRLSKSSAGNDQRESTGAKAKAPQVWHRDSRRPTFARVYVGNGNSLELVSLQVTTTIEGPRARTLVDHIFRNPHDRQLEGTFEYPLPSGASPSYFAMFIGQRRDALPARFTRGRNTPPLPQNALAKLQPAELVKQVDVADWGQLQEGRIVGKEKALETYEEIVRGRIDPALLEYAGGNTFSGRVFPIPPKGYNRVLIAYEELLSVAGDHVAYQFPLPDCKLTELQMTLLADAGDCKNPSFDPTDARCETGSSRMVYTKTWKEQGPGGVARFTFQPAQTRVQAISGRQGESGPLYFYARIRPELKVEAAQSFADHAVFLLDTSLSEHPDRFAVNMRLLKNILEGDPSIKQFNILTFNVGAAWVEPKGWLQNSAAGRDKAFGRLDGLVLEGATDLSSAFEKLIQPGFDIPTGTPLNVFLLTDGQITWGESEVASLVAQFETRAPFPTRFFCYRTGIGSENQELFEAVTRKGGGVFHCYGDADLAAASAAHRNQCLQVEKVALAGGVTTTDFLIAGRKAAVYPDGELIVAGQLNVAGKALLIVEGTFLGRKLRQEFPVDLNGTGELAARGWAEVAIASLLGLNDPNLDNLIVAYCQQFGVASRLASFLVLENDNDFKRLNLQQERGLTVPGNDLGLFVEQAWKQLGRIVSAGESFGQFLAKVEPHLKFFRGEHEANIKALLRLMTEEDYQLAAGAIQGALVHRGDVDPRYLAGLDSDPRNVANYLAEARRRQNSSDSDGAVRAISGIIEEYPARADALRLVGYRLLDMKQAAQAVRLFQQVQRNRPFEPHSYRDLARALEDSGKYALAAVQYEILLGGTWHNRFRDSLQIVGMEEYVRMMQEAVLRKDVRAEIKNFFGNLVERMPRSPSSDLRVTISWNTDATDVDLWVIEPDGTKCFYQHRQTHNGGELSQDQTQGYGPERYHIVSAKPGVYKVIVHYFRANPNLLGGETHVNVVIARRAGTSQESSEHHTVILKRADEQVEVAKVKIE